MGSPEDDKTPAGPVPQLAKLLAERAQARRMAPLMRELDERRMRALIEDYRTELEEQDRSLLEQLAGSIERTEGGFDLIVGAKRCQVEAGVGSTILIDGMPFVPNPHFYTTKTYHQFRDRLTAWARASGRL